MLNPRAVRHYPVLARCVRAGGLEWAIAFVALRSCGVALRGRVLRRHCARPLTGRGDVDAIVSGRRSRRLRRSRRAWRLILGRNWSPRGVVRFIALGAEVPCGVSGSGVSVLWREAFLKLLAGTSFLGVGDLLSRRSEMPGLAAQSRFVRSERLGLALLGMWSWRASAISGAVITIAGIVRRKSLMMALVRSSVQRVIL